MIFYLDSANLDDIQKVNQFSFFEGVTTNPTILYRANQNRFQHLEAVQKQIKGKLFIQLVGSNYEEMLADYHRIKAFRNGNEQIIFKVAVDEVGLQIMKVIKEDDPHHQILATTIYTIEQVILALSAGCDSIAPYYNRIKRNTKGDPNELIQQARTLIDREQHHCQIIAASFKDKSEVVDAFLMGAHACTISYDIFEAMLDDDVVAKDLNQFNCDHQRMNEAHPNKQG